MSEQNNLNASVQKYQLFVGKAGTLSPEEQCELAAYSSVIISSLYSKLQEQQQPQQQELALATEDEEEEEVDEQENDDGAQTENNGEKMKLAKKLVDDEKKKRQIEGMFGGKKVQLFSAPKTRNTWTQFASERREEFRLQYEREHQGRATDSEKTKWVNQQLSQAYKVTKNSTDRTEFIELQARANSSNIANGLCGTVDRMTLDQKKMMAQEMANVLRNNLHKFKEVTGLDSFVLFGSPEFRNPTWKPRRLGTGE
ncbi:hypothetical protein BDA99DRAFT_561051 [Phascolomyces articulosus]|uniref:Uncharacterized protein n=1 Tax=Phascolomyces articulosus TaxID=60185 RepID=A0AAD5K837_9FUNG|nr:hypothetical protein BDA99DRAFT_561051 [Phascolomyces articulosus]